MYVVTGGRVVKKEAPTELSMNHISYSKVKVL